MDTFGRHYFGMIFRERFIDAHERRVYEKALWSGDESALSERFHSNWAVGSAW